MADVRLRAVEEDDLPIFYDHQRDPESVRMAAFPSREDEDDFRAHWRTRILGDDTVVARAVLADGTVVGNVVSWLEDGTRMIGYWIGRDHWGRGIASAALARFVEEIGRPLRALVAVHNPGSIRVLEKCGFTRIGSRRADDGVDEFVYELAT